MSARLLHAHSTHPAHSLVADSQAIQGAMAIGSQNKSAPYTPPPEAGTPEPTGATGSRGGCVDIPDRPPLAALVGQPHLMLTTSDRPIFWIYVPYSTAEAPSGVLSLQQGGDALYEGEFSLMSTPGVVGIRLPETAPSLVAGQEYDWFIDIHCVAAAGHSSEPESALGSVDGLVQRVNPSDALVNDLSAAQTGLERVAAYGRHHLWYDWVTELAQLRLTTEDNAELKMIWMDVLSDEETVLLEPWSSEPLTGEIIPRSWR
ncbi:MAG: DUF928 domain-containing protein [Merismopedia sp. SIO2A8]|nr:DUF928 domain-containing protein [Merismopedia sp. SIO2A8]